MYSYFSMFRSSLRDLPGPAANEINFSRGWEVFDLKDRSVVCVRCPWTTMFGCLFVSFVYNLTTQSISHVLEPNEALRQMFVNVVADRPDSVTLRGGVLSLKV